MRNGGGLWRMEKKLKKALEFFKKGIDKSKNKVYNI